jgi:hypothetical protein
MRMVSPEWLPANDDSAERDCGDPAETLKPVHIAVSAGIDRLCGGITAGHRPY